MKVMQQSEPARNELVVDEITLDGKSIRVRNVDLPVNQVKMRSSKP